jgi:tetratricopeptide (TPR) repeat protein
LERRAAELTDQAKSLHQRGEYAAATKLLEQVLAIRQKQYPPDQYPQGHPDLATSLTNLGFLLADQEEYAKALTHYQHALAMRQRLYPKDQYPQGHPDLATSLTNLGFLFKDHGEYTKALPYYQQALAMRRSLYPTDTYPQGHPDLASSLTSLGALLRVRGEHAKALPYYQQALAMHRRLYSPDQYPRGHRDLPHSLNNVGTVLWDQGEYTQALPYFQEALALLRRLYPSDKFPQGHSDLAAGLGNLGGLLHAQADYANALPYLQQALAVYRQLYPADKYPQGHPALAASLNNLGFLLRETGEYDRALPYLEQALAMGRQLYPAHRHPRGHPNLAQGLNNLGRLLQEQGEYARALSYYEQALAMRQRLYPKDQYPRGHPDVAQSLSNVGELLRVQGEYARALPYCEQALAMDRQFYPADRYPRGHPHLSRSLTALAALLLAQGKYAEAAPYYQQVLAADRQLYPSENYPYGHPDVAGSLANVGFLLLAQGKYAEALPYLQQAQTSYQGLGAALFAAASEVEAFNFAAKLPRIRDDLLSLHARLSEPAETFYTPVWRSKAAITRFLERRREALTQTEDEDTQDLWRRFLTTRQELARLTLTPAGYSTALVRRVQKLSEARLELERQLAARLPALRRQQELARLGPSDLVRKLPPRVAFLDVLVYSRFAQDPQVPGQAGQRHTRHYLAFVLHRDQPVRLVELGAAQPVDAAVAAWRRDLAAGQVSAATQTLRQLVWEPLAKHLPPGTETVFLAPDGSLARMPWAALPGNRPGTVLLEDLAVALVPHGPFLLERLTAEPEQDKASGTLLALGGVRYDQEPRLIARGQEAGATLRSPERGEQKLVWKDLPGTLQELEQVLELAGPKPQRSRLIRRGAQAGTRQLLLDLPQARWAHLATHGFFADARFRSALQLDTELVRRGRRGERIGAAARNPLVLSGLVLAGANLPVPKDESGVPQGDGGILTAEAIAGLPLHNLELAVLSACETGLGEVAGGEGVFGLQRAFHLAGARNVIASLWKVDDQATAALMALFYHKLWRENKPPLAALREAQLTLFHHPDRIGKLAQARGLDFDKEARLPMAAARPEPSRAEAPTPPKLWAGFVLSGLGR